MLNSSRGPLLYQINTRGFLFELGRSLGRRATFDDISDAAIARWAELGFDWIWMLGVWQTGPAGRAVSRSNAVRRQEFKQALPDLTDDDISGSPLAVQRYAAHVDFGGPESLTRFRSRLRNRGLKLMLDFVPNHTALDHRWVVERPEYYVQGTDADLADQPDNWFRVNTCRGRQVMAHGRDPNYPGWPDTAQLNYRARELRRAMIDILLTIAGQCDGVRCDMAMLLLPEIMQRTWGERAKPAEGSPPIDAPFWPDAITAVHRTSPDFVFLAEAYWDLEWTLQQQGFDYTYDKRLYDRLHERNAAAVRGHLTANADFQRKSVRFLENHDEPRAAAAFQPEVHRAAAVVAYLVPGARFFHDGQLQGRRLRTPPHVRRRPDEPVDAGLAGFYERLLETLRGPVVHAGQWRLHECQPAWSENSTFAQFIVVTWQTGDGQRLLAVVNYGPAAGQCYVRLEFAGAETGRLLLRDRFSDAVYERDAAELNSCGLYLDMPAWGLHVFDVTSSGCIVRIDPRERA